MTQWTEERKRLRMIRLQRDLAVDALRRIRRVELDHAQSKWDHVTPVAQALQECKVLAAEALDKIHAEGMDAVTRDREGR